MNTTAVIVLLGVIAFSSAQNFQPKVSTGGSYKFISARNHTVLDVQRRQVFNGTPVIPFPWKESATENQLWSADEIAENVFIFSSTQNSKYVLDNSLVKRGTVIVFQKHGRLNQQWVLEAIHPGAFTFYIKSRYDNKVIELDITRKSVSLQDKNETNKMQRWVLADKI